MQNFIEELRSVIQLSIKQNYKIKNYTKKFRSMLPFSDLVIMVNKMMLIC